MVVLLLCNKLVSRSKIIYPSFVVGLIVTGNHGAKIYLPMAIRYIFNKIT
jgi:hypothetical protein